MVGTVIHRLGEGEETGGGDNKDIGTGFGGGGRRGIKWGLGQRRIISGSKRVEWSGMDRGGQLINLERQRAGKTAGEGRRSSKNLTLKRDRV